MKLFLKIMVSAALLFSLFAVPLSTAKAAAAPYSGTVTTNLNVRAKASASSKVIGWLKKGSVVQIYSTSKGWGETRYKNKKAYVSLKYIKPARAKSYTGTVTSNGLNVREKASAKSKIVGWLKKGNVIPIYSTSKGWGVTRYKNKKAYVSLKYIKLTPAPAMSFTMDKSKTYVYSVYGEETVYKYLSSSKFGTPYQWNKWIVEKEDVNVYYERESDSELLLASEEQDGSIGHPTVMLKYPLYVGQTWKPLQKSGSVKITSMNKSVKTPAGTFKNVIEVKSSQADSVAYYAKNIGMIKTIENGKTTQELVQIQKR